jgi:hypothetical protein
MNDEERIRQAMAIVRTRDVRQAPSLESVQRARPLHKKPQLQWVQVASAVAAAAVLSVGGYSFWMSISRSHVAAVSPMPAPPLMPAPPPLRMQAASPLAASRAAASAVAIAGSSAPSHPEAPLPIASKTHLALSLDFLLETNGDLLSRVPEFEGDR